MEIAPAPLPVRAPAAIAAMSYDEAAVGQVPDNHGWKPTKRFILAFGSLLTAVSAVAIESTSLPTALPIMSADLGGTAYSGAKDSQSIVSGSLIAAFAHNFNVVLVGRIIQGAGGGGLIVLLEILISDLVPLAHGGTWFSINSAMWGLGTFTGPLIGAGFAQDVLPPSMYPSNSLFLISRRPEINGEAAGFFSFIRVLGQALSVANSGVIFQNSLKQHLLRIPGFAPLADEYSRDATAIPRRELFKRSQTHCARSDCRL
ncbi:hypothetical protein F4818DRAFT_446864 [Hypoxylon cercidicola]|nr:hypothetical protein F4818DRAFT_446864 [Hypoxylon cercidicola]